LKPLELIDLINDAASKRLFCSCEWEEQVNQLRPRLKSVEKFIGWNQVAGEGDISWYYNLASL
jgi:hypothetical protein